MEDRRKWLLSSAAAREKAEKESKLYYETARFVCDFFLPETEEEERKVLDVVSSNIIDIYSNYEKVFIVKKHNEDDVSEVIKEYRSKVENELNYLFENTINVATKQAIKDFIVDFKQGDVLRKHAHISEDGVGDDDINNRTRIGRRNNKDKNKNKKNKNKKKKQKQKKKAKQLTLLKLQQQIDDQRKLNQEADHYLETILFMHSFAHNQETTPQERITLYRAYFNVYDVYTCFYIRKEECRNISSIIKEHRSKVEEELTYVCNNVSDVTIKQAFSQLLADFQSGPKPKDPPSQIHHPHLQDKDGSTMSSKPNMSSGEGSCKPLPICDNQLYYHDHHKCCPPFVDESKYIYEVIEWIESEDDECPDLTFADVESEDDECPDLTFADVESEDDECPDLTFAHVESEDDECPDLTFAHV